jgi:hypothetical protein
MLRKWLCSRSTRSPRKDRRLRPWLESLEERNAPSGVGPGDNGGGGSPHHAPPPTPTSVNTSVSTGSNAHGSFNNSTFTNSFNTTITNNITVNLTPTQSAAVQGLTGATNLLSALLNNPQLGTLLDDEIAAAVDTYLTSAAISALLPSSVVSSLTTDLSNLNTAIASQATSPILDALGTAVFTLTLDALTTAQPTF